MAPAANAQVTWKWSFSGGAEAGTFVTNGAAPGGVAPSGSYNISDFTVTASTFDPAAVGKSLSGGGLNQIGQAVNGFVWNGAIPTDFFRNSGQYTNGSNFFSNDADQYN